jgi:hypothetical protein
MWNQLAADYLITDATIKPYSRRVMRSLAYEGRASLKDRPRCFDVGVNRRRRATPRAIGIHADRRDIAAALEPDWRWPRRSFRFGAPILQSVPTRQSLHHPLGHDPQTWPTETRLRGAPAARAGRTFGSGSISPSCLAVFALMTI